MNIEQPQSIFHSRLLEIILRDEWRMDCLYHTYEVGDGNGWIGGGFIRNMVWDFMKGNNHSPLNDLDVIYLGDGLRSVEQEWEKELYSRKEDVKWSVTDQNRIAKKHGLKSYQSIDEALSGWVEKCTAIAVRWNGKKIDISAPYGMEELFDGIISPTRPAMANVMRRRIDEKHWLEDYPFLEVRS